MNKPARKTAALMDLAENPFVFVPVVVLIFTAMVVASYLW